MDKSHATMVWGSVAVVVWRGECTAAAVHRVGQVGLESLKRSPKGAVLLGVLEATAKPPSQEMRKLSAAVNDRLASQGVAAIAGVLSGGGFRGSIVRGVITGLNLLSNSEYPFQVFEGHPRALHWLARELHARKGVEVEPTAGSMVVGRFRRNYAAYWASRYGGGKAHGYVGSDRGDSTRLSGYAPIAHRPLR